MSLTPPTRRPPICTSSPFTSWPAFWKISLYRVPPPPDSAMIATTATTASNAPRTAPRAIVISASLHPERAVGLPREELPHERVLGVEQLLRRTRLDDPAAPQHGDELGHAPRAHDVVRDDDVGAAVLLVDLLDQLAQQRGANRVQA